MSGNNTIHNVDSFTNKREKLIFNQSWLPEKEIKAIIIFIHGYAEHSGRYGFFAELCNQQNVGFLSLDLEGFGRSEGTRADINKFSDYIDDVSLFYRMVKERFDTIPVFIMGHSMGANIAIQFAARFQDELAGLILTAPPLKTFSTIPKVIQDMAGYISAIAATVPVLPMEPRNLSSDAEVVKNYQSDPLVYHGRIRARMALQLAKSSKEAVSVASELKLPVWAGHGTEDKIAHPDGTKILMGNVQSEVKTSRFFEGFYHDILMEPEYEQVVDSILDWVGNILDKDWDKEGAIEGISLNRY